MKPASVTGQGGGVAAIARRRRALLWGAVPLGLLAAWFAVRAVVRSHVDGLIEHAVGRELPPFALADRSGRVWTDADLRGKRAVLHFFRSRCSSCDAEAAEIRALEQSLPGDAVLLHVMTDALLGFAPELTAATIAGKAFARPIVIADEAFLAAFHQVRWSNVTPITYVVDAAGVVRFGLRGRQTRARIEQALAAAG